MHGGEGGFFLFRARGSNFCVGPSRFFGLSALAHEIPLRGRDGSRRGIFALCRLNSFDTGLRAPSWVGLRCVLPR